MSTYRKTYTREFKVEAVRLSYDSDTAVEQLALDLGVSSSSLNRWRAEYAADGAQAFPGKGKPKERDRELAELKRELHVVRQERDILKKALAVFAREQK